MSVETISKANPSRQAVRRSAAYGLCPHDPQFLANPYPIYHQLRSRDPVLQWRKSRWVLTRYADVTAVLKDARFGHECATAPESDNGQSWETIAKRGGISRNPTLLQRNIHRLFHLFLTCRTPSEHTRLRKLVNPTFSASAMADLSEDIKSLSQELVTPLQKTGVIDLVADFAQPFTIKVISKIMGAEIDDAEQFGRWSRDLFGIFELEHPELATTRFTFAMTGLAEYFRHWIARREKQPGGDLISSLLRHKSQGRLSADEVLTQCVFVSISGYLTTSAAIGNSMYTLLRHPNELRSLQRNPDLVENAVEELLRYEGPAHHIHRTALEDVQIGDKVIRRGDRVFLMLAAANRDPEVFSEPDRLDISRQPNAHLAFSHGGKYCSGARLARLELQIAITTLLQRLPDLDLQHQRAEWGDRLLVRCLKSLPVVF